MGLEKFEQQGVLWEEVFGVDGARVYEVISEKPPKMAAFFCCVGGSFVKRL